MIPRSGSKKLIEGSSRDGLWRTIEKGVEGMLENGVSERSDSVVVVGGIGKEIEMVYQLRRDKKKE